MSTVNAYQNRYYFYADDRQNTLLCALDEHAVGFAVDHSGAPRLATFPLFAKRGSLLAIGPELQHTGEKQSIAVGKLPDTHPYFSSLTPCPPHCSVHQLL